MYLMGSQEGVYPEIPGTQKGGILEYVGAFWEQL